MNIKRANENPNKNILKSLKSKIQGIEEMVENLKGVLERGGDLSTFSSMLGGLTSPTKRELTAKEREDLVKIVKKSEDKCEGPGTFESRNEFAKTLQEMSKTPPKKKKS